MGEHRSHIAVLHMDTGATAAPRRLGQENMVSLLPAAAVYSAASCAFKARPRGALQPIPAPHP
jgi:hypothetical protein